MKSVGEAMGIGRSFSEAFLKAQRARELDDGWEPRNLHPWFEGELEAARQTLNRITSLDALVADDWLRLKRAGWSDAAIAEHCGRSEELVRTKRRSWDVRPAYRRVDSCAGEVEAASTYYYSTWGERDEAPSPSGRSVVILGSGPNRIGQGIEFDYCCVHAARSYRELGFETVMVNCNPETVSTDYDTSDRLYFEPLGVEEVLAICEREQPVGVVIQFGGQTPLKLARAIEEAGRILGTPFDAVDLAEERERFGALCRDLGIEVPAWGWPARRRRRSASRSGSATRFSCGRPTCSAAARWSSATTRRVFGSIPPRSRVLVDRFLEGALELDVDALCDGTDTFVAAVMQHVEEAGVHSGDSSCVLPPPGLDYERRLDRGDRDHAGAGARRGRSRERAARGSRRARVRHRGESPRLTDRYRSASKAIGVNLVEAACRLAASARLSGVTSAGVGPRHRWRQSGRFPVPALSRLRPGARARDAVDRRGHGQRRRLPNSSGEAERARAGRFRPAARRSWSGDEDKEAVVPVAAALADLGFSLAATSGTARVLAAAGAMVDHVRKVSPSREKAPLVDLLRRGRCDLVVNTPGLGCPHRRLPDPRRGARRPDSLHHHRERRGCGRACNRPCTRRGGGLAPGEDRCSGATCIASSRRARGAVPRSCASSRATWSRGFRASSSCSKRPAVCCLGR